MWHWTIDRRFHLLNNFLGYLNYPLNRDFSHFDAWDASNHLADLANFDKTVLVLYVGNLHDPFHLLDFYFWHLSGNHFHW